VAIRFAAAAATLVALLALSATATYAAGADLSSRLAPPPGADWVEAQAGPTILDGPFDSHSYDTYLQTVSPSTQRVEHQLNALAFRAGYGRMWVQGSSQDVLVERVFEFGDKLGAHAWYENLKLQNQFTKYMVKAMPPLDGTPDSFGVVLKTPSYMSYRVEFVVQNLVFTIHMDSAQNDRTAAAVGQALAELRTAAASPSPAQHNAAVVDPAKPALPWPEVGLATAGGLVIVGGAAAIWWRRRRT